MTIAYIPNPYQGNQLPDKGGQGWLQVRLEPSGPVVALPMYLKVDTYSTPAGGSAERDYFTILEGPHRGKKASVSFKEESICTTSFMNICLWSTTIKNSRLTIVSHNGPCTVRYRKVPATNEGFKAITEKTTLQVGAGLGADFRAAISNIEVIHQFDLLKPGTYKLKIPDYDHTDKGQKYVNQSKFATTWYPISEALYVDDPATTEKNEKGMFNRYFHPGRGSAGCLTITQVSQWDRIVEHVSRCRLDVEHAGYVEILAE
ncbi:MAG TPA: hypothetical protein DEP36_03110 [Gammaproteobacteria bacterium]|nr:hypothetical protein [Gammaproteobacteria bacterium]HRF45119.1 hypothetical protein [Candidatus Competibacteraceae bacterium]